MEIAAPEGYDEQKKKGKVILSGSKGFISRWSDWWWMSEGEIGRWSWQELCSTVYERFMNQALVSLQSMSIEKVQIAWKKYLTV